MADTRPTPIGWFRAAKISLLLLFAPSKFIEAEEQDIAERNGYVGGNKPPHRAYIVRRAFLTSMLLVVFSAAIGWGTARLAVAFGQCATTQTTIWLQVLGAGILLWGTLFVRGWEIQTFSGVVFTERVNQWLYRFLYCVGTAVVVFSLLFPQCKS